jgi:hypothetical protein
MKDSQENKLSMYEAVLAFLALAIYAPLWSAKPAIVAAKAFVENSIKRIRLYRLVQERNHKGLTTAKTQVQSGLVNAVLKLIDGLVSYASSVNDQDLLQSINYTKSDLTHERDNNLVDMARVVYTAAEPRAHELSEFEVTEADITAVDDLIGQYEIAMPAKRVSVNEQKVATKNIEQEFKSIDLYFRNTFDNLMLQFRTSQPDFYKGYLNARIIINLGTRSKVAKPAVTGKTIFDGVILNFGTGLPEAGVKVTLIESLQSVVTGADGKYSFTLDKGGPCTLTAEKAGFTTWNEDTTLIETGQHYTLEIQLEPIES